MIPYRNSTSKNPCLFIERFLAFFLSSSMFAGAIAFCPSSVIKFCFMCFSGDAPHNRRSDIKNIELHNQMLFKRASLNAKTSLFLYRFHLACPPALLQMQSESTEIDGLWSRRPVSQRTVGPELVIFSPPVLYHHLCLQ